MKIWPFVFLPLLLLFAVGLGAATGMGLAVTKNTIETENFTEFSVETPTKILDVNGELITEFSSDQKRELIPFKILPQLMVDALLTREDKIFYSHPGFSMKALFRAVLGVLTHNTYGGGSTLTQQIAGTLYCNRQDMSVGRKLKELWWSIQMERRYSKNEILELYLNRIYFGGGTYGVSAACKYYFGHDATEVDPAEAAILVIQLSNPAHYSPFDYPNRAMARQQYILDAMVDDGFVTREEADKSFDEYWANFDYLRNNVSVHAMRVDNAPWFSEYVRRELSDKLYGTNDIYTDGFTVNTTLNLAHQKVAEEIMTDYIKYANDVHGRSISDSRRSTFNSYVPLTELISLVFNIPGMKVSNRRSRISAMNEFANEVNPVLDILAMMMGMEDLKKEVVSEGNAWSNKSSESSTVEGTMVALENKTGYVDAMVGGSKFDYSNQYIRAVQSLLQPGSSFKPLYYSAAIDSQVVTMTTPISDTPSAFINENGSIYLPQNYVGSFRGEVEVWYALSQSLNIPALKILDMVGFDAALTRAADLLGIPYSQWEERGIVPVYSIGLGTCSVRPIEIARAFAIFGNNGEEVIPISIRNVEDRNGNIVLDLEREALNQKKAKGADVQIISKQNAFIMQEILKKTVSGGTLYSGARFDSTMKTIGKDKGSGYKFKFTDQDGKSFEMPVAGKTGTTQNWADAWAVGFTPYYTAAFWFGFDTRGESLGLSMTGSGLAGPPWGDFMHEIHKGKAYKPFFDKMPEGIVKAKVCADTGYLAVKQCPKVVDGYYYKGTEPTEDCEKHKYGVAEQTAIDRFRKELMMGGLNYDKLSGVDGLFLNLDFLSEDMNMESLMDDFFSDEGDFESEGFESTDSNWMSFFDMYNDQSDSESDSGNDDYFDEEIPPAINVEETASQESETPEPDTDDDISSFFE